MKTCWIVVLAGSVMLGLSPAATAAPPNFPDLAAFQPVNPDDYRAEHGYATEGVRFSTPDGLHCSLSHNVRGSESVASCRGDLPGTGGITGVLATSYVPTVWQDVDLSQPEMYLEMDDHGLRDVPVDPSSFRLLPVGSRITYQNITCVVGDEPITACIIDSVSPDLVDHGFVLRPGGSSTF
ncbi:hypothetical protein ABIA30_000604 [Mycobacterium sp. MAA66]|uniref:hypothetical protein n=1 Tax=Mycobacterium sp. MAA66 TaxID=3156297 RepID=UPI0035134D12